MNEPAYLRRGFEGNVADPIEVLQAYAGYRSTEWRVSDNGELAEECLARQTNGKPGGHYCLGFVFNQFYDYVILSRKSHGWTAGKLNGAGGKIEPGETPAVAMSREFVEEFGLDIPIALWREFGIFSGPDYRVHCFVVSWSGDRLIQCLPGKLGDAEKFGYFRVRDLLNPLSAQAKDLLPNVPPLLAAAMFKGFGSDENITGPKKPLTGHRENE